ncbi:MAG: hypothetical protein MK324_14075 [Pirellulales bacterium]|jgi:hypothetical protein|nr:hypothetical protein [Pirellulales bacterium]
MNRFYSLLMTACLVLLCSNFLKAETYCLKRGDVITHVNTLNIHRIKDFWKAIKHSETTIYLTVQTTEGIKKALHVQLPFHKLAPIPRFGVDVTSHKSEGVRITNVRRNSPATRCQSVPTK